MSGKEKAPRILADEGAVTEDENIIPRGYTIRAANAAAWSTYGAIVRARADELGLTGQEFAQRMGAIGFEVSRSFLGTVENGSTGMKAENFLATNKVLWGDPLYAGAVMPLLVVLGLWRKR